MLMPRAPQRIVMSATQRWIVYTLTTALWLSGCIWLVLDQLARHRDPFGGERNPWQSATLTAHGVLAVAAMYLLGWVTARHIAYWWNLERRRISGSFLSAVLGLLTISGFALFFLSDDRWQQYAAIVHDVLGVAVAVLIIQHWFLFRRASTQPPDR
ncbi:MAG TPA: hypothetical protein VHZ99_12685 [Steroidobacteraceae bacterium]|jgi:hypothetical protein|nr:hypothetical protein [Steroidobacteraceae bacterium]